VAGGYLLALLLDQLQFFTNSVRVPHSLPHLLQSILGLAAAGRRDGHAVGRLGVRCPRPLPVHLRRPVGTVARRAPGLLRRAPRLAPLRSARRCRRSRTHATGPQAISAAGITSSSPGKSVILTFLRQKLQSQFSDVWAS
jgi:hypothetical protein